MKGFYWIVCAIEVALLPIAAGLAYALGHPLLSDLRWNVTDFFLGIAASIPLCALFWWMMGSSLEPLARIRRLLVGSLTPLFGSWSLLQLAFVSVLAGISEEILFRSVIQGAASARFGPEIGLALASVLFGAVHLVTRAYGVIAALIGVYLGLLWLAGGNLLIPIVTHAAYDFVALVYLLRIWNPRAAG